MMLSLDVGVHSVKIFEGEWRHYMWGELPQEYRREFAEYVELGGRVMRNERL